MASMTYVRGWQASRKSHEQTASFNQLIRQTQEEAAALRAELTDVRRLFKRPFMYICGATLRGLCIIYLYIYIYIYIYIYR